MSDADDLVIAPLLDRDESVAWRGRPSPRAALRGNTILPLVSAVPFLAFIALMAVGAGFGPQTFVYAIFVGFGLWHLSRPWRFYRLASRCLYAVTDRRVLIVLGGRTPAIHSIPLAEIRDLRAQRFPDGGGHVLMPQRLYSVVAIGPRMKFTEGLWGIDDPSAVVRLLRSLRPRRQRERPRLALKR